MQQFSSHRKNAGKKKPPVTAVSSTNKIIERGWQLPCSGSLQGIFGHHVDVLNAIFVIDFANRLKAKTTIESLQMRLRTNLDGMSGKQAFGLRHCLIHQLMTGINAA